MARGTIVYPVNGPSIYKVDGNEVTKEVFDATFPSHPVSDLTLPNVMPETSKAWPMLSDAWGVGKGQKEKAEEVFAKLGVPTEFVPDGAGGYSAKVLNNEHKRRLHKATATHHNDGGYGQVTG